MTKKCLFIKDEEDVKNYGREIADAYIVAVVNDNNELVIIKNRIGRHHGVMKSARDVIDALSPVAVIE